MARGVSSVVPAGVFTVIAGVCGDEETDRRDALPPWKRQYNAIDCLLKSCLNWQETASITVGNRIRANVDNVSQAASQKITFLQDALIYSLRHHLLDGDGVRETGFNFYKALTDLFRKDRRRSELYFYGLAIAKLFRAQMTTRSGGPHHRR